MPQNAVWWKRVQLEEWILERRLPSEGWLRSLGLLSVQLRRHYTSRTRCHLNGDARQMHMLTTTSAPKNTEPRISKSTASWLPHEGVIRIYTEINVRRNSRTAPSHFTKVR